MDSHWREKIDISQQTQLQTLKSSDALSDSKSVCQESDCSVVNKCIEKTLPTVFFLNHCEWISYNLTSNSNRKNLPPVVPLVTA